jgi:transcriptional regulator with GAF, ATPase, and Fis domain
MDLRQLVSTVKRSDDAVGDEASAAEPHLFVALECHRPASGGSRHALAGIDEVTLGRGIERLALRTERQLELRIPDPLMSSSHARVFRSGGTWSIEDDGSTNGTFLDGSPVTSSVLDDGVLIELGNTLLLFRQAVPTPPSTAPDADYALLKDRTAGLTTLAPELAHRLAGLSAVMRSTLPVLLLGETGTGKEVLARAVHAVSGRAGPFVAVNCGAIPESLVESQLFGHVKGAFSGAVRDEPGFVRASDGGTLFLDEVGDLPKSSQAALLRVLQESEVVSVGSTRPIKVDLRVVSATHAAIDAPGSAFRSDLFARLAGYVHMLTPLRSRREDLGLLVAELLPSVLPDSVRKATLAVELGRALFAYDWPFNVRELKNALSSAAVLAQGATLQLAHAPEPLRAAAAPASSPPAGKHVELTGEDASLRDALVAELARTKGNVSEVARAMGRTRMQVHRWMRRFAIDPADHRKR